MRSLHKYWQDKNCGWTRRVRWYQGEHDIHLKFEDEAGTCNKFYVEQAIAQADFERFKSISQT
jgi:hypothetical protein